MTSTNGAKKSAGKPETEELGGGSLSELARRKILEGIQKGDFPPGARVPEREVSEALNISRTPVREAIRQLQSEGLLVITPHSGAEVVSLSLQEMIELYSFRETLEQFAAAEATKYISAPEIELLEEILLRSSENLGDMKVFAVLNKELHSTIHRAAHNRFLLQSLATLDTNLALMPGWHSSRIERVQLSHDEHVKIVEAIRSRDAAESARAIGKHIRNTQSSYLKSAIRSLT